MKSWIETRAAAVVRAQGLRRNRVGVEPADESAARILDVVDRHLRKNLCTFVTAGPDGPTARIVMPLAPTPDRCIHIATAPTSTKARQAAATGRAVLLYSAGMSSAVTAYCSTETLDDPTERRRWWRPLFSAYWPDGPGADSYTVIRCRPDAFEVFAPGAGVGPAPHGLRAGRIERDHDRWRLAVPTTGPTGAD